MGADLAEKSPSAQALYQLADEKLGWPVTEYSFRGPEEALTQTRVCQPALYTHGLAVLAAYRDLTGQPLRFEAAAGPFPWANTPRTPRRGLFPSRPGCTWWRNGAG